MPSKIKQDAMDMILAVVRDNPGITSKKVIDIIPAAPSTARVCITMLIKKKNILMIKRGTERVLYTAEHVAENNIKGGCVLHALWRQLDGAIPPLQRGTRPEPLR